jgi:hypothetical protein
MPINTLPPSPAGEITHLQVREKINEVITKYDFEAVVKIRTAADVVGPFSSTKLYVIDTPELDMTGSGNNFEVPPSGLTIEGLGNNLTTIICSDPNYSLFTSPVANSGNLNMSDLGIQVTGSGSKVYDLTDSDGTHAAEVRNINYYGCTSLGEFTNYRQILQNNIGRFGGTPELTFNGTMGGYREDESIVQGISDITALFKAGAGLTMSGRLIVSMNCNLPAVGALCDFAESNILNDESLNFNSCRITRQGVIDTDDAGITPNITEASVKSKWTDNTGMPDTTKYLESFVTAEVETNIIDQATYYPLAGTWVASKQVQFDSPVEGQYRLLTGNGAYRYSGEIIIKGTANDEIDVRVTVSNDGGSTFPVVVNHLRRTINDLRGTGPQQRDVAIFVLSFIDKLKKGDRFRVEVENINDTNNVTAEIDSYINVSKV